MSGLFGVLPMDARNELGRPLLLHGTDDPTTWNDIQQVFPRDGFKDLYQAYKASSSAGDAHVFVRSYEVRWDTLCSLTVVYAASFRPRAITTRLLNV